jgi:hypothetical protein
MEKALEVLESDYSRILDNIWIRLNISYDNSDTELFKKRVDNILKNCFGDKHSLKLMVNACFQKLYEESYIVSGELDCSELIDLDKYLIQNLESHVSKKSDVIDSTIQQSIKKSIMRLISIHPTITSKDIILSDSILTYSSENYC